METREELLEGLNYVKGLINKIIRAQNEQVDIVAGFRQKADHIATSGVKNTAKFAGIGLAIVYLLLSAFLSLVTGELGLLIGNVIGVAILYFLLSRKKLKVLAIIIAIGLAYSALSMIWSFFRAGNVFYIILILGFVALAVFLIVRWVRKQNDQVDAMNEEIAALNAEVQERYDANKARIEDYKTELVDNTSSWYPRSYYSLEAVSFFIQAIENFKADNMKEAINLFDDSQYKNQMLSSQQQLVKLGQQQVINQEEMKRQLRMANVLNVANLALSYQTLNAVQANTSAVNRQGNRIVSETANQGRRIVNAINRLRK